MPPTKDMLDISGYTRQQAIAPAESTIPKGTKHTVQFLVCELITIICH